MVESCGRTHAIKLGKMVAEMRANHTWVQAVGEQTFAA